MSKTKATSVIVSGVEFQLPFKMKKARFTKLYGGKFGEKIDEVFEALKK